MDKRLTPEEFEELEGKIGFAFAVLVTGEDGLPIDFWKQEHDIEDVVDLWFEATGPMKALAGEALSDWGDYSELMGVLQSYDEDDLPEELEEIILARMAELSDGLNQTLEVTRLSGPDSGLRTSLLGKLRGMLAED